MSDPIVPVRDARTATRRFTAPVAEGSSWAYMADLVDPTTGLALDPASVTTFVLTLRDVASGAIVNGRDSQDVRNANGGSLAAGGAFQMIFGPLDNAIIGTPAAGTLQERRATFKVAFTNGHVNHEVVYYVQQLADAP